MSVNAERLDELADAGSPAQAEQFRIHDLGGATWAMRKLAALRQRQAEIEEFANAEIARIRVYLTEEVKTINESAAFFEQLLTGYHRELMSEGKAEKTIKLPHGALRCRAQQPEFIRNEEELLAWAEATDPVNLVEVKKSARWAEIKKYGKPIGDQFFDPATGEVIPGVVVVPREPKFTVDVEVL